MPEDVSQPKNIFEAASKIEKVRARKEFAPKKETPQKEGPKEELVGEERGKERVIVSEIFLKGKKLHEEISSKVDFLFSKSKIAPSDYRQYVSRPQNFSQKQWQLLEEQRKKNENLLGELAEKIGAKVPTIREPKKEAEKPLPTKEKEPEKKPPEKEEKPKPKKPKIITKRQWIGM